MPASPYKLGLRFDLGSLITRGAAVSAARAHLRQVDLHAQATGIEARTTADADLVELQFLRGRMGADARRQASALGALDALLGLRPGTPLHLAGLYAAPEADPRTGRPIAGEHGA